jgi:hypothetical protein
MKRIASVQSNYIPWKGHFDLIASVDEFIFFDDMQYTRRDWRNRNRIKTASGTRWLTIPVEVSGRYHQRIDETAISDPAWARSHWSTLAQAYRDAPHFRSLAPRIEALYGAAVSPMLSEVNQSFTREICAMLGIDTRFSRSTDYGSFPGKTERLVSLCLAAGGTHYVSGPTARDYLDPLLFERAGLVLEWMDYGGYPEYPQLHPPFEHTVTVLDLLFNTGPQAPRYMKFAAGACAWNSPS